MGRAKLEVGIVKNKVIALLVVSLVLGILVGLVVAPGMTWGGGSVASWLIHVEAQTLVDGSDRIVIATYVDDRTENISKGTNADGEDKGSITERFRRFTVVESLKGDAAPDDTLYVVATEGSTVRFADGKSTQQDNYVVGLETDVNYVLFLESVARPDSYPNDYGDVLWTSPGEPDIARIDRNGRLTFLGTERYQDILGEGGLEPVSGSAAPFELTKADIQRVVSK